MIRTCFLLIVFLVSSLFVFSQVKWPVVDNTMKPWTRWWWEGSAVNKKGLTWDLEQLGKAGLGGVEITPIYGVHGYEKEFIEFLSPKWMQMLDHTLAEAKRMGLGVDLANATGWPFGGPWITDKDASKTVYFKMYTVDGGKQLSEPVEYISKGFVRTANNKAVSINEIQKPISANKNLQDLALDQVQFPGKLPLQALMAYSGSTVLDLTNKVDAAGKLNWIAPDGNWTLYAVFEGLHGKMVERAAPGGEGYAIDHFSLNAANNYFKRFDQAFKGHDLSYLRAFFNDSYEVDDARGQGNWTSGFFAVFKKKKGYDLRDYLPALFGKDEPEKNSRIIYDYRSVIDELILENFTKAWKKWGTTKDAMVRNQSHGSPANTLDLYSAVDIPETEGNNILRFKFATSAANVTGKKWVSSESVTWLNEHFLSSLGDVKKAIDLYFLGGVNHIFYHGSEYSPKDAPWPGWLFYAAVHFQPTNPQWKDFSALNTYITRVQSFLQRGKPANNVLLYYPIVDRYSEPGRDLLQHFDGMERNFVNTDFEHVSKWMLENGYSFDFFSDRQLQKFNITGNKLLTGGNTYQTILLPANKLIPEKSFQKIIDLARRGARILVYKDLPRDVPGWAQLEARRKIMQQLLAQIHFNDDGKIRKATIGKGAIYIGNDIESLLQAVAVTKESFPDKNVEFVRRKNNDGFTYFITNRGEKAISEWIPFQMNAASSMLFDPMTSNAGMARVKKEGSKAMEVYIQLQPFESVILQTFNTIKKGNPFPYIKTLGEASPIEGEWTIEFTEGGPVLPAKISTSQLGSWTEFPGEDVKNFSGRAKYSINFQKPATAAKAWILDLGKVNETAEVWLNGKRLASLIGPAFRVTIPESALQSSNRLEIIVANLMANRISYMDRNNLPWKIFYNTNMPARRRENSKNGIFDASAWKPLPSGLSGPVTLTPVNHE